MKSLVVSIHDVSPGSLHAVRALRGLVAGRVDGPISLLLVPRMHGREHWEAAHASRVREWAERGDELVLHGYSHLAAQGTEREFGGVSESESRARIAAGRLELATVGLTPTGFVAPCYAHPRALQEACRQSHLEWWATRGWLHSAAGLRCLPSIGVGASTRIRRTGSPMVASALARGLAAAPHVRLDLHPADIEHPRLTTAGLRLLEALLDQGRELVTHGALARTPSADLRHAPTTAGAISG